MASLVVQIEARAGAGGIEEVQHRGAAVLAPGRAEQRSQGRLYEFGRPGSGQGIAPILVPQYPPDEEE